MKLKELAQMCGIPESAIREEAVWDALDRKPDKYDDNTREFKAEGEPYRHVPNAVTVLRMDSRWSDRLAYNEFSAVVEIDGKPISDEAETMVMLWMHGMYRLTLETKKVGEAIRLVARERAYHPVRRYLRSLTWDGEKRLGQLLSFYMAAEDTAINQELGIRWAISAVARIMDPGCKVDTVLILVGKQGAQKSTAFRELAGNPGWFSDTPIDIRSKDAYQAIAGVWLYEMAELASMRPREAETVKAFIAAQVDRYRPPYGRNPVNQPRQCVFVGTTNEAEFLRDPTGARRFWPVRVCHDGRSINIPRIASDRDQLWAEAVHRYQANERWWLDINSSDWLEEEQEQYREIDPWEEGVRKWLMSQGDGGFTVATLLEKACDIGADKAHSGHAKRANGLLAALGYEKQRERQADGKRPFVWYRKGKK